MFTPRDRQRVAERRREMRTQDKQRIAEVARIFRDRRDLILMRWLALLREHAVVREETQVGYFERGFEGLLNDFGAHLAAGDFDGYYAGNGRIAREIAYNDVSFRQFIDAFHLFEESYADLLIRRFGVARLGPYLAAVDRLHHTTIAIVAEAFFDVKEATVFALAKLAELRDPETAHHLERTREYSRVLAGAIRPEGDFAALLYRAGPLHDIGKVGIPDRILLKAGDLTEAESAEMRMHTVYAARTIDSIIGAEPVARGSLRVAREICLYHHERYDGGGYPEGLRAETIPLSARVFALADSYDAIVSKRPYKEALPHGVAVDRIRDDAGKHFDPAIVQAFLGLHPEFDRIKQHYGE
jgi:HD-GYP domain-containing protein (c-di-GMP phosphodiesterase class II)